jgi:hypothetical protein
MATAPVFDGNQVCLTSDPELFFPELHPDPDNPQPGDQSRYKASVATAKKICFDCSHVKACLEYSLLHDVEGIWGGTTKSERKRLRKEKGISSPQSLTLFINEAVKQKGRR